MYEAKDPARADWADWLYEHHVFVVAARAKVLAQRYGADVELAQVAALLHDIADTKMKRFEAGHEEESLKIARECMQKSGYEPTEVSLVVDDAIKLHSCRNGQRPKSKEGLVLATADALAHVTTDYYIIATQILGREGATLEEIKAWVLKKNEKDFVKKICFDDVRKEVRPSYELIKALYSRSSQ